MMIPKVLLKKLYTQGSLKNTGMGAQFALKNRLSDVEVVGLGSIAFDGRPAAIKHVYLETGEPRVLTAAQISSALPLPFPLRSTVTVQTDRVELAQGRHDIEIAFETRPFGRVRFKVQDAIGGEVRARQAFVEQASGVKLRYLAQYSFDPPRAKGNCESFTGAAQVPVRGHAGGLLQSRHEGAECVRRRQGDGGGRCHAARARVRVSRRAGRPRFRALGGW